MTERATPLGAPLRLDAHGLARAGRAARRSADGRWAEVTPGIADAAAEARERARRLPLLPGLVNAHSHAFQRAFAGHAERRESAAATTSGRWRDRMYRVALRISPGAAARRRGAALRRAAARAATRRCCEFHYLQHDIDGQPLCRPAGDVVGACRRGRRDRHRPDAAAGALRARRLRAAALRDDQRRFHASAEDVWQAAATIAA